MQTKHNLYLPFVSFQPYFGQNPRSTETWNNTTVRAGVALKFGQGKTFNTDIKADKQVSFSVDSPSPGDLKLTEIFPLRNYVYFNNGSSEILTVMFY
jgi:hypothetical protein